MRILRQIKGVTLEDKVSSDYIRRELGVCDIFEKVRETRLRLFGHSERMEEDNPAKRAMKETAPGKSGREDPDGNG